MLGMSGGQKPGNDYVVHQCSSCPDSNTSCYSIEESQCCIRRDLGRSLVKDLQSSQKKIVRKGWSWRSVANGRSGEVAVGRVLRNERLAFLATSDSERGQRRRPGMWH